jgi:HEAT repeat protein
MALDLSLQAPLERLDFAPMVASLDAAGQNFNVDFGPAMAFPRSESPRAPWASSDPADSLYRIARESLNSGDYRRAAQLFAQITKQYPTSQYSADASYWRAFALYRIGDTADLHTALQMLDSVSQSAKASERAKRTTSVTVAPRAFGGNGDISVVEAEALSNEAKALSNADQVRVAFMKSARRSDNESAILAMRIRSALAARGDATAAAQIANAAGASATSCDDEDASLRIEALNALVQMDPKNAEPAITKVLARRDTCSVPLRRGAIALAARNDDAQTINLLNSTAWNDPSIEVQAEAIRGMGREAYANAISALSNIVTSSKNSALQRIAVRQLAAHHTPEARQALRSLMSRTDLPTDVRVTALHYAGESDLQIADLTKIYDASADRSTRQEIVSLLGQRQEPEAADELINIARTSTDPALRRRAIDALMSKKDPRTTKLLMDILNK